MGKYCLHASLFIFDRIITKVAGNQNRHKSTDKFDFGERGGSVVECPTPEREVGGSKPTSAVLCPWARHFTPRKYWLITQEAVAPSRHDWKIVDWDVKPQHKQTNKFDFGLDQNTHFGVTCPWMTKILHIRTWISLRPADQSWSNFMCSITRGGERLHKVLRLIGSKLWCPWQQKVPIDL